MSGILNTRRTIATALMITVAATAFAAPALAGDPTPDQSHLLLQSSDLPASYGKPTDASFTNVQSGGVLASACTTATFDSPATTIADQLTMTSEIVYPKGPTWSQSIDVYASEAQAKRAFAQMRDKALRKCNGTAVDTTGDDGVTIPARRTVATAKVKDGIIIATVKSTTAGGGTPPYGDSFVRILTKQTGNAIESLRIIEDGPKLPSAAVTARYEAKQDAIFTTLVSRYHD